MNNINSPKGFNGSLRTVNGIFSLASQYQKRGVPFTLTGTNGAYRLHRQDHEDSRFYSQFKNGLTPKELGVIRKVKNHILKNDVYLSYTTYLNPTMITYVDIINQESGTEFNDVYEVDMDEAYWRTAFNKSIISKDIYNYGSKAKDSAMDEQDRKRRKMVRLIALGALAKKSKKYIFSGKKIILTDTIVSDSVKLTQNIWYSICKHVSDIMLEGKKQLGSDYLMFWVDGIYFRGEENVSKMKSLFQKYGYEVKIKKIPKVYYQDNICHVVDDLVDPEENTRKFNLPKRQAKREQFTREKLNKVIQKISK